MFSQLPSRATMVASVMPVLLCLACLIGCGGEEQSTRNSVPPSVSPPPETPSDPVTVAPDIAVDAEPGPGDDGGGESNVPPMKSEPTELAAGDAEVIDKPGPTAESSTNEAVAHDDPAKTKPSLDELLTKLEIPPPWLAGVETSYDTSQPWKEARLEIRRLLGLGKPETHREAIKLTWIYLQKDDIGDGHEYPMYTFLGGEPVWSIPAHEEYLKKPHENTPIHAYITLAAIYAQYGEFEKAKANLDTAMAGLPVPPWQVMRKADIQAAYGDLYAKWGKIDEAKECYARAIELYPTAKPPYGRHLLPRRAAKVQSLLDLLTVRSLETTTLRDGRYRDKALGYAGDIDVTLVVEGGVLDAAFATTVATRDMSFKRRS
jgi:hypothetical protein